MTRVTEHACYYIMCYINHIEKKQNSMLPISRLECKPPRGGLAHYGALYTWDSVYTVFTKYLLSKYTIDGPEGGPF